MFPELVKKRKELADKLKAFDELYAKAKNAKGELDPPNSESKMTFADFSAKAKAAGDEIKTLKSEVESLAAIAQADSDRQLIKTEADNSGTDRKDGLHPKIKGSEGIEFARHGQLKAFKGEKASEKAYACGQFIMATIFGYDSAREWCKNSGIQLARDMSKDAVVFKGANESSNTQGGFLVPVVMENAIIDLRETYGMFRQFSRVRPMTTDYTVINRRAGGLTAYPVGEGAQIPQSTKLWSQVPLTARKWGVLSLVSTEISEDAVIGVADDVIQEMAYAFAVAEDDAGFNGDGTPAYHGITGVATKFNNQVVAGASTLAGALDAASGHDTFAEIDSTDLTNLMAKLPKYATQAADCGWYISQPGASVVFGRLNATAGGNTMVDQAHGFQSAYLGYPINVTQSMPTSTADLSDKAMILFGSLKLASSMGSRRGVTIAQSTDFKFDTDEIAIRGTERFDINIHDIGDTSTAGPLVALIGE